MLFSQYPYLNFSDYNLDWIIRMMNELLPRVDALEEWRGEHEDEYKELKALYDAILKGDFPESMMREFYNWCQVNVPAILKAVIKQVWFGLTDDGYFCAWIPESWDDIIFNTTGYDMEIAGYDYGHLVLSA